MSARSGVLLFTTVVVIASLTSAGSAAAGTDSFSGTVANGGCAAGRSVSVSAPSRIEVSLASTAQNNTNVFAEIVSPTGQVVGGGSATRYDTPGAGTYSVRVCSAYEGQSAPQIQYSGLIGTGPAGKPVLVGPAQPQPATGGVLGARTTLNPIVSGKAAIMTRAGLAWFRVATTGNATITLRVVDPVHHVTRLVKGLTAISNGKILRITGHGLKLVVRSGTREHVSFTSRRFHASGKVVRGHLTIVA